MDFLCELIFEIILEGVLGLTIESPKVKTWVKTGIVSFMCTFVLGLFAFIAGWGLVDRDWFFFAVGAVCFLGGGILSVRTIIKRHKEDWKMPDSRR